MDASTVFVVILTLASVGALVGVEMHARRKKREEPSTPTSQQPPETNTPQKERMSRGRRE